MEPIEKGQWPADDLRRAFVKGAKWWEFESTGATMWPSDQDKAETAAELYYPKGRPRYRRAPKTTLLKMLVVSVAVGAAWVGTITLCLAAIAPELLR